MATKSNSKKHDAAVTNDFESLIEHDPVILTAQTESDKTLTVETNPDEQTKCETLNTNEGAASDIANETVTATKVGEKKKKSADEGDEQFANEVNAKQKINNSSTNNKSEFTSTVKEKRTAIVIDSTFLFRNFIKTQSQLFTHIMPINIITAGGAEQVVIDNDDVTIERFVKSSDGGQNLTTSQPTLGQISEVIANIEKSPLRYDDAFFLCINSSGSGYYNSLNQYLKEHKKKLKCRYWIFSLNTLFYSAWWLLKKINIWVNRDMPSPKIYSKLKALNYREMLIGLPTSYQKIRSSGRFTRKRFAARFIKLMHVKLLLSLTFTKTSYNYKFLKVSISFGTIFKHLGRIIQKNKKYKHVIAYYCIRDLKFLEKKLAIVKRFSKNKNLEFYIVEMPVCYFALFHKNYFFSLHERKPHSLPFIESIAIKFVMNRRKVSK